jgi:hypothetical protein
MGLRKTIINLSDLEEIRAKNIPNTYLLGGTTMTELSDGRFSLT